MPQAVPDDPWPEHFPQPTTWVKQLPLNPRPLLPIYPPPNSLLSPPPPLPSRSTVNDLDGLTKLGFKHTSHLIPACFLRSTPPHTLPEPPSPNLSKEERTKYNSNLYTTVMNLRAAYNEKYLLNYQPGQQVRGYRRVFWHCINRFVRTKAGKGNITLLVAHANGFSKEIWEPSLKCLLESPDIQDQVGEIWSFEPVQHGDSAFINRKTLQTSGLYCWADHSRDIIQFLTHFLPTQLSNQALPTVLPNIHPSETHDRLTHGLPENRRVIAVGHSFGGCTSAMAAIHHPKLFSSLVLVDPVIHRPRYSGQFSTVEDFIKGAIMRKSTWKSREDALAQFSKNPFFQAWHPSVLEAYLNHCLFSSQDGQVHLKTPPMQEAISFAENEIPYTVWHLLPSLDKDIPLHYIMPGQGKVTIGLDIVRSQELVWLRPENCSHVRIGGAGHLIPLERPKEFAEALKNFLLKKTEDPKSKL
ncbi:Alpha/beta hydrolase family-domain-containing protein [Flagelloscypha sp. PMI_526]|nr:Alpha/beta hydrolase family-domain-containing protein [Flagelloscypha sp. PMI_526]